MTFPDTQFLIGFLLAAVISALAWKLKTLDLSGALAAFIMGTIVFGLGGTSWSVLLLAFFITSSGLSKLFKKRKINHANMHAKGMRRDAWQVLANGGISTVAVLFHLAYPHSIWPWLAFAGSLAAANADTWATELGVFSRTKPRMITTGQPVEVGTSGAVSAVGTFFAFLGALLIGLLAGLPWTDSFMRAPVAVTLAVSLAGLIGSLVDSLLGATVQAVYYCDQCKKETEKHPQHSCGHPTHHLRGWLWLNNDWVNLACTFTGAVMAVLFDQLL